MGKIDKPTQAVLVTARHKNKDNIITLCWWTRTSFEPELYLISVGHTRYSHELIASSGRFAINFLPFELSKDVLFCGTHSGRDVEKFEETSLTKEECEKIDCPRIKEALSFVECKVVSSFETGDHTVFVGKVVNSKFRKKGKRVFQVYKDRFTTTLE